MGEPRVVHLKKERYDVRIDRASPWGNQFRIGPDGTREEVVEKHKVWFYEPEQAAYRARVRREMRGKVLGCWCAPHACHGDTYLEYANGPEEIV